MKNTKETIAQTVATAYNQLDADLLNHILAENLEYSSFWVFSTIEGKDIFLDYLKAKFQNIKNSNSKLIADVICYKGEFFPRLIQDGGEPTFMHLTIENGLILNMCLMPFYK